MARALCPQSGPSPLWLGCLTVLFLLRLCFCFCFEVVLAIIVELGSCLWRFGGLLAVVEEGTGCRCRSTAGKAQPWPRETWPSHSSPISGCFPIRDLCTTQERTQEKPTQEVSGRTRRGEVDTMSGPRLAKARKRKLNKLKMGQGNQNKRDKRDKSLWERSSRGPADGRFWR